MSENQDLTKIKDYFIKEYRANGGTEDLSEKSYEIILAKLESQKEIAQLKKELDRANSPPHEKPKFNSMTSGVNNGRYNAELAKEFATVFGAYQDYIDPPFDERILDDESFKRDNSLVVADQAVILRDREGRCDAGGPSKYKGGNPIW